MESSLLAALPDPARRWLQERTATRELERGEALFRQGDRAESMYVVLSGRLAVEVLDAAGNAATMRVAGRGAVLGEFALLLADRRRTASAVALQRTRVRVIGGNEFEALRRRWPEVDRALVQDLARRLIELSDEIVAERHRPAAERVLVHLLALDDQQGGGRLRVTQQQLASLAGCSRQTANEVLREASQRNAVLLGRGSVVVVDRNVLRTMVNASGHA